MIRVLVADDQAIIRQGLRMIIDAQPDMRVDAEAGDGRTAISLARATRPDVCLIDIRMPGPNGVEVTRALAGPHVTNPHRVVIVTTFDDDEYVEGALAAGAVGFILKDAGPTLLVEAVRAAHAGDALISPQITRRLLHEHLSHRRATSIGRRAANLSERELEVVGLVAGGLTNQEVAEELFIALSTVKSHMTAIQQKLGARNRVEVAAWAWANQVGPAEP